MSLAASSGNVTTQSVTIQQNPEIQNFAATPFAFNPNNGQVRFTYKLTNIQHGYVVLNVYNAAGVLVRTIYGGYQSGGSYSIPWNGRNSGGVLVPQGQYKAVLSVSGTASPGQIKYLLAWGSAGSGNSQFGYPIGLAKDAAGRIYVVDSQNGRVKVFTSGGTYLTSFGSQGSGPGQFDNPSGIAIDSSGYIYVADTSNQRIQKFRPYPILTVLTQWGTKGTMNGQFQYPTGLAIDSLGYIYVADSYNDRIEKFNLNGNFIAAIGVLGTGNLQFHYPTGLAVDSSNNLYVVDSDNSRIQKLAPNGAFITSWGSHGTGNGQFLIPDGIAVDSAGNVYVTDISRDNVQQFSSTGKYLGKWGSIGSGYGQFNNPSGILVDNYNYIYVTDTYNNRVQKFSPYTGSYTIYAQAPVIVDTTAPTILISTPINGATYARGSIVRASWTATDSISGIASYKGTVPSGTNIDTRSRGTKSFTVTATDRAGNTAKLTVRYTVV